MAQVLCFGDSITLGLWDGQGGWVQRLRTYVEANSVTYEHVVYNVGIDGDTSNQLLKRIDHDINLRKYPTGQVVIIAIGTNDSVFRLDTKETDCDEASFSDNLSRLVTLARKHTEKILLIGTLPCEESKMQPMPWSTKGKSYSNERLKKFNAVIQDVAKQNKLVSVDMFDEMLSDTYQEMLSDGIHPNDRGHEWIYNQIKPKLMAMLENI